MQQKISNTFCGTLWPLVGRPAKGLGGLHPRNLTPHQHSCGQSLFAGLWITACFYFLVGVFSTTKNWIRTKNSGQGVTRSAGLYTTVPNRHNIASTPCTRKIVSEAFPGTLRDALTKLERANQSISLIFPHDHSECFREDHRRISFVNHTLQ